MVPLACPNCGQRLQFEAYACPSCGKSVAFEPVAGRFRFLDDVAGRWCCDDGYGDGDGGGPGGGVAASPCANARYGVCNWLVPAGDGAPFCRACRHNRMIPDLGVPGVLDRWRRIEEAKRRVVHSLVRLGVAPLTMAEGYGLVFDFLYDPSAEHGPGPQLMTGHAAGVVTLNLIEADDVARERLRRDLGEPYRTLVGHFRHEIGHYYWHRYVEVTPDLGPFRTAFGDERADYGAALARHYATPPPAGWEESYVSAYATMHPWEDFAETFAHYLHLVDTLASIAGFGLTMTAGAAGAGAGPADAGGGALDPWRADTAALVDRWIPLAFALNGVNRAMGRPDLYPFRMTPAVVRKLDFVNRLLAFNAGRWTPGERENADLRAMIATLGHGVELGG